MAASNVKTSVNQETSTVKRILVTGDDAELARRLDASLAIHQCSVECATGYADALHRLRQLSFDVALTDPKVQFEEDLALLDEMRLVRPGIRAIVLAPEATPEELIAALRARVFACFSCPYDPAEVVSMVKLAVDSNDGGKGIEVLSAHRDWIELRVTCQLLTAERLVRFMTELRSDLPDLDRANLITAFREILLNAMEHGAGFNPESVVEVSAVRTARAIVYHFRDPGPGFSRDALPHAAISNAAGNPLDHVEHREKQGMRPGGFGILLSKQLVDELIYNEAGNEVLLVKHAA